MSQGRTAKIVLINFGWIFLALCFFLACGKKPDLQITSERLSDRVIAYDCLDVRVTAVASQKGMVVIDTHRSPYTMKEIRRRIEQDFGRKDFAFVVNTHGDWDHSSGNQVFLEAEIIGHEKCPEYMRQKPANSMQTIGSMKLFVDELRERAKKPEKDGLVRKRRRAEVALWQVMLKDLEKNYHVTPPIRTFGDSLVLYLGDLTLKMWYAGRSHTNNHLIACIPEEKLAWTGDLFTSRSHFGFAVNSVADVPRTVSVLNRILDHAEGIRSVVPGHGNFLSGDDLGRLRDLLGEQYSKFGPGLSQSRRSVCQGGRYGIRNDQLRKISPAFSTQQECPSDDHLAPQQG